MKVIVKMVMTMTLPSEGDCEDGDDNDYPVKVIVKMVMTMTTQ